MRNFLIGCLSVIVLGLLGVIVLIGCRVMQERENVSPIVPQPVSAVAPTIKITLPATGSRVRIGQAFLVHAVAVDPRGIYSIDAAVDGQMQTPVVAAPPLTTFSAAIPITLPTKGVHTIVVQANSTTSLKSEPAAIKVVAVQALSDPTNPDDPPAPAPLPQPNPNPVNGSATISFTANPTSVQPGQCSTLRWDVDNVREVYFEGAGVAGHADQQQCPSQNTTYTLTVILIDGSVRTSTATVAVGNSSPSGQAPVAPANLRVTSTTQTTARIAWDDRANNEDGFEIQIEGGASSRLGANASQFEATGLTCHRSYNFRVRAFNATGNSAWSNQVTAQTLACEAGATAPTAPTNLRVTSTTKTSARLAWDDRSNNETRFEIDMEGGADSTASANATQSEITGLTCNRAYNFRVRAVNAAGNSAWSNQVTAQTLACDGAQGVPATPAAPSNLRVTSTTKTSARIAWNDNANNETGFEISVEGAPDATAGANASQYEATGLSCNRAYNFRVRAVNAAGNSAWSNQVTAQTLACQ
ncbi:MAG: fibronectin type III domain-containing protein [Chloroflexi bacterium]|nr:fibronectin type III domain-containing protein [Chloroflexota bacterium]